MKLFEEFSDARKYNGSICLEIDDANHYLILKNISDIHIYTERFKKYGKIHRPRIVLLDKINVVLFKEMDVNAVLKDIYRQLPNYVSFSNLNYTDESNYDMLYFDLKSKKLSELKSTLISKFDNKDDMYLPIFPYVKICFLKKGYGVKYRGVNKYPFTLERNMMRLYYHDHNTNEKIYHEI